MTSGNLGDIVCRDGKGGLFDQGDGTYWSLAQIDDQAGRFAAGMVARGLRRGDRVAILAANGGRFIVAYLGLMRAGMVPVPINYGLPAGTIAHIVDDSGARLLLHDQARSAFAADAPNALLLDAFDALLGDEFMPPVQPSAGEIAEILYTSGSSGVPKGVPLSHAGQLWALRTFQRVAGAGENRTIVAAPTYHMNGLFFTLIALMLGYDIVTLPRFEADTYLRIVAEHRCTILSGIPTMFAMMAREEALLARLDLGSVREITIGSAPLDLGLVVRIGEMFPQAVIRNGYGSTETGPAMFGPHPAGLDRPPLALGYPFADVECRLVGEGDPNEGVLEARTPATLTHYLNRESESAERLHDGWFRTGDVMRRDEHGFYYFLRRADDMFVCGGENVYPNEVERLIERHPDIAEAVVVAVDDAIKGAIPIAFVVPRAGHVLDPAEIKRFTLAEGPAFSHPRAVVPLQQLPVGPTFKLDKAALKALAVEVAASLRR